MSQAAAGWRWARSYPAGLSPDVALDTWPVHSLVERSAERWGDKTALVFRDTEVSYAELRSQVDRAASAFLALGLGRGARIALLPDLPLGGSGIAPRQNAPAIPQPQLGSLGTAGASGTARQAIRPGGGNQ